MRSVLLTAFILTAIVMSYLIPMANQIETPTPAEVEIARNRR